MNQQKQIGAELSFIDRLIDGEQSYISRYRSGLRRDLEDLLNTSIRVRGAPPFLEELDDTLVNYGIMDLFTANLTTVADRERIKLSIKKKIEVFEPRLINVEITQIVNNDARSSLLSLRIFAETIIDETAEEIIFNSTVDVATGLIRAELMPR
jgi:type VI secretion system protein ImpF